MTEFARPAARSCVPHTTRYLRSAEKDKWLKKIASGCVMACTAAWYYHLHYTFICKWHFWAASYVITQPEAIHNIKSNVSEQSIIRPHYDEELWGYAPPHLEVPFWRHLRLEGTTLKMCFSSVTGSKLKYKKSPAKFSVLALQNSSEINTKLVDFRNRMEIEDEQENL